MAACHQKWLNDSRVLLLKCFGKFPIRREFIVWRRWGGKLYSLNLFNTKMTSANKAIRRSLIGGVFTGTVPQEAAGPPWSRAAPQALWRLCSFSPSLCLSLSDPSLSPLFCLPVYLCHSSILHALFYPRITFISIPKPHAFPPWLKCY